ncbi:MAG: DNA polymerase III subunit delta [Spirochaetes bacterium]|nr:DNA polymerase III subunit delta [Spirochaetota bacterium]
MSKRNRVFLLLGPETGKKAQFVEKIVGDRKKKYGEKPEIYRFYPYGLDTKDVVSILRNGSLFASSKIVLINKFEELRGKKLLDPVIDYCKDPSDDAVLILLSDSVKDIPVSVKKLVPKENTVIFWEMFESEKKGWIINFFNRNKIRIEQDAVNSLLDMIENNTRMLKEECTKLAQFFSEGALITADKIEDFLYHSKEENVFSLFARMVQRDFSSSLDVLDSILLSKETDADKVLSGILWQIEKLLLFRRLIDSSYQTDEALSKAGIIGKRNQKNYNTGSKNFKTPELERIIRLIYETKVRLRTYGNELHTLILQLFFYYVILKAGKSPWLKGSG